MHPLYRWGDWDLEERDQGLSSATCAFPQNPTSPRRGGQEQGKWWKAGGFWTQFKVESTGFADGWDGHRGMWDKEGGFKDDSWVFGLRQWMWKRLPSGGGRVGGDGQAVLGVAVVQMLIEWIDGCLSLALYSSSPQPFWHQGFMENDFSTGVRGQGGCRW